MDPDTDQLKAYANSPIEVLMWPTSRKLSRYLNENILGMAWVEVIKAIYGPYGSLVLAYFTVLFFNVGHI